MIGASSLITYYDKAENITVGIANWEKVTTSGSRYNNLLRFAATQRPSVDWKRYSTQLKYVLYELNGKFNQANSKLLATTNIKEASKVFNREYLFVTTDTESLARFAYDEVFV